MASWDLIVRTFFSDSGLSAGLQKANAQLQAVAKSGPGARAGLRAVEMGTRQLAFSAAGLTGGIGNLARGLLMFGGGSALMLGAAAGIGALALAYRHFTKDTREAEAAQVKLREELHRVAQAARDARMPGTERIGAQQGQRQSRFQELTALITARQGQLSQMVPGQMFAHETEAQALTRLLANDKELNALYRERRALAVDIHSEAESSADAAAREADERRRALEEWRRLKLEQIDQTRTIIRLEQGGIFQALRPTFAAPAFGTSGTPRLGGAPTFANIRAAPKFYDPLPPPKGEGVDSKAIAQMAMMSLMMGSRGGASGAFGAAGGLLSGISGLKGIGAGLAGPLGWAGFGLSALGSVFGMFNNDEERRHKEQMRELKKISERPATEPTRFVLNLVDPVTGRVSQTMYEIGRREDRDAQDRIPGGP